jgi:translation initiation factor 1
MPRDDRPTVWSSSDGDMRKDVRYRQPPPVKSLPPQQQTAYLHRSSKGRGGKPVTLVKELVLSDKDLKALAKKLKRVCGSGGTIKDSVIEIQGEHREKIADVLRKQGFQVKIAGG